MQNTFYTFINHGWFTLHGRASQLVHRLAGCHLIKDIITEANAERMSLTFLQLRWCITVYDWPNSPGASLGRRPFMKGHHCWCMAGQTPLLWLGTSAAAIRLLTVDILYHQIVGVLLELWVYSSVTSGAVMKNKKS